MSPLYLLNLPGGSGCPSAQPHSDLRRKVIKIAVAGLTVPWVLTDGMAHAAVTKGDCLVDEDAEGAPVPLKVTDLRVGKPMVAYPFDAKNAIVRNESRLNKLILLKLPEADMDAATKARSAGGVIAYSAICTHQACDAKTWLPKEKALVCFCHSSKFLVLENGAVANGPAARSLPSIALALEGDQLVIAGAFSAPPGTGA
jgi:rieske iron-sulfur protein